MRPDAVMAHARAAGWVGAEASWPVRNPSPWAVVLVSALGAWVVALSLMAFIAGLLGAMAGQSLALLLVGVAQLVAASWWLRDPRVPLFLEQMALALLLAGLLCLGWWGVDRWGLAPVLVLMAGLCLALAWVLPQTWLRGLLGMGAAACGFGALAKSLGVQGEAVVGLILGFALFVASTWVSLRLRAPGLRAAAWSDALLPGFVAVAALLLGTASGSPWLGVGLNPVLGRGAGEGVRAWGAPAWSLLGAAAACLAAAGLARAHADLRRPQAALLAVPALLLAALLPALGPLALLAALAWHEGRRVLLGLLALVALWVLGSFYYQLSWPLLHKAGALAVLGVALALWCAAAAAPRVAALAPARRSRTRIAAWVLAVGATVAVVQFGIRDKERLIAEGQPLLVKLAPVDPRSLMQGDYMALRFELPETLFTPGLLRRAERPVLVVRSDTRGVAADWRRDDGSALAAGERRVELSPKDGRWVLVTDAWFFREGEADRWQPAQYGEFRVDGNGRALLVGLRDAALRPL